MKNGVELIADERERQITTKGWDASHDDTHVGGDMLWAACCYVEQVQILDKSDKSMPETWPWDYEWWKPSPDPIRNLVKAGALIAAEIDRLQRVQPEGEKPK